MAKEKKARRTIQQVRIDRLNRRGPGGLFDHEEQDEASMIDQTGDSRWSDLTSSTIASTAPAPQPILVISEKQIVDNVAGKRKSNSMATGNSNWELTDDQSTLRNNDETKSPPAKRRSAEKPLTPIQQNAQKPKETEEAKKIRLAKNAAERAKIDALAEKYEKAFAENAENQRRIDEILAAKEERRKARAAKKEAKRQRKEEDRARRVAEAKEAFRKQEEERAAAAAAVVSESEGEEEATESKEGAMMEDQREEGETSTRTIVQEESAIEESQAGTVRGSETYVVEQGPSSMNEPSNRTFTIPAIPEGDIPSAASTTFNSSGISVADPTAQSTPLHTRGSQGRIANPKPSELISAAVNETVTIESGSKKGKKSAELQAAIEGANEKVTIGEKKGRGRPRKSESGKPKDAPESKTVEGKSEKKKRGRAKTTVEPESESVESKSEKKKRGRPKKVTEETEVGSAPLTENIEEDTSPLESRRKKKTASKTVGEPSSKEKQKSPVIEAPEQANENTAVATPERPNFSHSELDPGVLEASVGDDTAPVFDPPPVENPESENEESEDDDEAPPVDKTKHGRRKSARFSIAPDEVRTFEPDPNEHVAREKGSKKKSKKERRKSVIARDEVRAQRSDSPVGDILLDYVVPCRTPPRDAIRRSKRICFVRGALKRTNDLSDIRPMLTEEQINRGDFNFISEVELHKKVPKVQKDKNCPFSMTRFERLKKFGKASIDEPIDDIYAEEKFGWAIGSMLEPTATIEDSDGEVEDVSSFVASDVRAKWRAGCEPGEDSPLAFTNLGPLVGNFYSKTTYKSPHFSIGTLFFTTSSELIGSTSKIETVIYKVVFGEITASMKDKKQVISAGTRFIVPPKTKEYSLKNLFGKPVELSWERALYDPSGHDSTINSTRSSLGTPSGKDS